MRGRLVAARSRSRSLARVVPPVIQTLEDRRLLSTAVGDFFVVGKNELGTPNFIQRDVLANDTLSGAATVSLIAGPAHAAEFSLDPSGAFLYRPARDYVNNDTFTYRVTDSGGSSTAVVTIKVNAAPHGSPDPVDRTVDPNAGYTVRGVLVVPAEQGLLINDADENGDPFTCSTPVNDPNIREPEHVSQPSHGVAVVNFDGSFTYTPDPEYTGLDSFEYRAFDGYAYGNDAHVYLNVYSLLPLVASDDEYTTPANHALTVPAAGVLMNDSINDPQGPIALSVTAQPGHGSVSLSQDGSFVYTPAAGYVGMDSFIYSATDGVNSNPATVTINVLGTSVAAASDVFTIGVGQTVTIPGPGVLANDLFPAGSTLTLTVEKSPDIGGLTALNNDGSFAFTVPANPLQPFTYFRYTLSDGAVTSAPATIYIQFPEPVIAPTGTFDLGQSAYSAGEGQDLVLTVIRSGGSTGAITVPFIVTAGSAGNGDYTVETINPLAFADGQTSATILIHTADDHLVEADETFTVTLGAPSGGGLGTVSSSAVTIADNDVAGQLAFLGAAHNIAEGGGSLTVTVVRSGGNAGEVSATLVVSGTAAAGQDFDALPASIHFADGQDTQTITIPILNDSAVEGPETIVLTLADPTGGAALGAVAQTTLTIADDDLPNQPPAAGPVSIIRRPGQSVVIDVRPAVSNPDGDPLTIAVASPPASGAVTISDNGTPADPSDDLFIYAPAAGSLVPDQFVYSVSDGRGGVSQSTVTIGIVGAGLDQSPFNAALMDLVILGTEASDGIIVTSSAAGIGVAINGEMFGPFVFGGRIVAYLGGGDDRFIAREAGQSVWAWGGAGNDWIEGGLGNDVLLGHGGNDVLRGNGGHDLLVGGLGRDSMAGGAGRDVLIGGRTRFDGILPADQLAFNDVQATLVTSKNLGLFIRRITRKGGVGVSRVTFSSRTIDDDRIRDILNGGAGDDWLVGQTDLFRQPARDVVFQKFR